MNSNRIRNTSDPSGGGGGKIIIAFTYAYMVLPFVIFAVGWMRLYFWLPIVTAVLFCTWKAWNDTPAVWSPQFSKDNIIKTVFICTIIAIWIFYSGIGHRAFQNSDHYYRNRIFQILVEHQWPVYNRDIVSDIYPEGTAVTSLIYYIGFWMPAAIVGKLFGLEAGFVFQMIWAFIGILLVYYYICARKKTILIWPLALLIFFSGLDIVGISLVGINNIFTLDQAAHIEWWISPYQYSAMTTQLFWVFNQSIPAWLCTVFAMQHTNNRSLIFLLATCMLHSTFPFIGLLVLTTFWMLSRRYDLPENMIGRGKWKCWTIAFIKDSITIQNLLGGGIIGVFTYLYLRGNVASSNITAQGPGSVFASIVWARYLIFVILEVGIYFVLTYRYNHNRGIYFAALLSLIVIPLSGGSSRDFTMRVSIPALLVLLLIVQDTLEESRLKKDQFVFWGLVVTLCIGSVTPIHEITRAIRGTVDWQNRGIDYTAVTVSEQEILNYPVYTGGADHNLFFDYIAKPEKTGGNQ